MAWSSSKRTRVQVGPGTRRSTKGEPIRWQTAKLFCARGCPAGAHQFDQRQMPLVAVLQRGVETTLPCASAAVREDPPIHCGLPRTPTAPAAVSFYKGSQFSSTFSRSYRPPPPRPTAAPPPVRGAHPGGAALLAPAAAAAAVGPAADLAAPTRASTAPPGTLHRRQPQAFVADARCGPQNQPPAARPPAARPGRQRTCGGGEAEVVLRDSRVRPRALAPDERDTDLGLGRGVACRNAVCMSALGLGRPHILGRP